MPVFKRMIVFIESDYLLIFMFMNIVAWGPQVNLNLLLKNDTVPLNRYIASQAFALTETPSFSFNTRCIDVLVNR